MRIYNTLTREKEEVRPAHPDGKIRMYECGLTPYDEPHIGNARTTVVMDTLRRWLEFRGMPVIHVKNVTDVEDKIIDRANKLGITCAELVARFDQIARGLYARLNLLPPTHEPYATHHIPEIIALIERLIAAGLAYASGGDVYYAVRKFPGYGKLSRRILDELLPGARVPPGELKKDPLDFDLWKAAKPGEPQWDSPWGPGRPGWHIECSAMSMKYLGESFDIHGGGNDLMFPHHENEIAQSEGATGKPFARLWVHAGFVTLSQEKMSKSVGNIFALREVVDRMPPGALRLLMGQTHYRAPFEWADDQERQAKETYESLRRQLDLGDEGRERPAGEAKGAAADPELDALEAEATKRLAAFDACMDDDLSTPRALAEVFSLSQGFSQYRRQRGPAARGREFWRIKTIRDGILARLAAVGIVMEFEKTTLPPDLEALLREREDARKRKDWKRADEIRAVFHQRGWVIEDMAQGPVVRKKGQG